MFIVYQHEILCIYNISVFIKFIWITIQGLKDIYSMSPPATPTIGQEQENLDRSRNKDHTFLQACYAGFDEMLYYRAQCPWPVKDRDYVMARRFVCATS